MRTTQQRVTPQKALDWLSGNTHNRPVRQSVVEKYARDMAEGRWRLTHQGIAFDPHGTLIDGQHRLWAIVESKATIELMVTEGMEMAAQEVIDGGEKRRIGDVLHLRGEPASPITVGIATMLCTQLTGNYNPTRVEVIDTFDTYKDAIEFVLKLFPKKIRGLTTAPVLTPFVRASFTQDKASLDQFARVLTDGMATGPNDRPIIILRNFLLERKQDRKQVYGKTERALQAYLRGETITTLYATSDELFLLPVEQKALTGNVKGRRKAPKKKVKV